MLKLSQARLDQIKEIDESNFFEDSRFGCLYLCEGDDLVYINAEDDDEILSRIYHGERIVAIKEDDD